MSAAAGLLEAFLGRLAVMGRDGSILHGTGSKAAPMVLAAALGARVERA